MCFIIYVTRVLFRPIAMILLSSVRNVMNYFGIKAAYRTTKEPTSSKRVILNMIPMREKMKPKVNQSPNSNYMVSFIAASVVCLFIGKICCGDMPKRTTRMAISRQIRMVTTVRVKAGTSIAVIHAAKHLPKLWIC